MIARVIVLAGGLGTRLSEMTDVRPKPMVEIGGKPILAHILRHYAKYGVREAYVALGYKGEVIKRWLRDEVELRGSLSLHAHAPNQVSRDRISAAGGPTFEFQTLSLVETGHRTMTGGRLRRVCAKLREESGSLSEPIFVTYGDGVSNVDLASLLVHHRASGCLATITAVRPPARFGAIELDKLDRVRSFLEKRQTSEGWINGGFMVLDPRVIDRIESDDTNLEHDVLEKLAAEGLLSAYKHEGFWQCMDTVRDVKTLEDLWATGFPPWEESESR